MRKRIIILLTIFFTTYSAFGQKNNESLYRAIVLEDTSLVKQLLVGKADPNYIKEDGPWMKTSMLITAVNKGNFSIVRMLIANKVNINWKDSFKTSALMYAASKGNKKMVVLLLENNAEINDHDGNGSTVLTAAKESKNKELIKMIKDQIKAKK